jgi:hypothetical protein
LPLGRRPATRQNSLSSARTYSNLIFAGAVLIWLFNLLLAIIRGTGNLIVTLIVVCGGALVLRVGVGLDGIFLAAGVGMAAFGCLSLLGLVLRVGYLGRSGPRRGDWPARNRRK